MQQSEADYLLAMPKFAEDIDYDFPPAGRRLTVALHSGGAGEVFLLDISRGSFGLKRTFQNRARTTYILARLDYDGPPHTNPDGQLIVGPHLHTYKEGFGDKWATPLPCAGFVDVINLDAIYNDFLNFCSVVKAPRFIGVLS